MTLEQRLLQRRQYLIGVLVEACAVLLRLGAGNRLVMTVEQIIEADAPGLQVLLELRGDGCSPLAGQVIGALVVSSSPTSASCSLTVSAWPTNCSAASASSRVCPSLLCTSSRNCRAAADRLARH